MKLEQRKADRISLSLPIVYKVFQLNNLEKDVREKNLNRKAEIQDLSLDGIQVVSEKPFEPGEILEFEVEIPEAGLVRTVAKVVWCRADESKKPAEFSSGIQFIPVDENDLNKLKEYFRTGD